MRGCPLLALLLALVGVISAQATWNSESELSMFATKQKQKPLYNSRAYAVGEGLDGSGPSNRSMMSELVSLSSYFFNGMDGQFAEFPAWEADPVGGVGKSLSLSFQFRTQLENAFLLYVDDGGDLSFLAVTVTNRAVRLRFKFGLPRTVVITLGSNLNDNRWHTVQIEKSFPSVRLTVDGRSNQQSVASTGAAQDLLTRSSTYIGGLPSSYKIGQLALPSIYFERKFAGWMRQIAFNGHYVSPTRKFDVLEQVVDESCSEFRNPCRNNGVCYRQGHQTACDCSGTSFSGQYCDQPFNEAVAMFTGAEWLKYDVSSNPASSLSDVISLSFKTAQPNGLIFHTGKSADFVSLSLMEGGVQLVVNLGSGAYKIDVQPKTGRLFNDDKWHRVQINRTLRKVDVFVDQAKLSSGQIQESFRELTLDDAIYVGGSPATADLPGAGSGVQTNFVGCLKEVTYVNDANLRLPLSRMAKAQEPGITVNGNVQFACAKASLSLPVSFITPESRVNVPSWGGVQQGSIQFSFRTTEKNGLLIYGEGSASDLFAIEMYDGKLCLVIDLGSQTSRFLYNPRTSTLYDGMWHSVKVSRYGRKVVFVVDGNANNLEVLGTNSKLDLLGTLSVGGADFGNGFSQLRGLWTAPKRQGFVGCLTSLRIDDELVNLRSLARSSGTNMGPSPLGSGTDITAFCGGLEGSQCRSGPCQNGARCKEGMNRFICDCADTSFKGKTCGEAVMSASFDGTQHMTFPMAKSVQTVGEDISLRFRTPLSSGTLFGTVSSRSRDLVRLEMVEGGRVKLTIDLDCSQPNCTAPRSGPDYMYSDGGMNDGRWHSVKVTRRGQRITFGVDGKLTRKPLTGRFTKLEFDSIYLAKFVPTLAGRNQSQATRSFAGVLQNVVFNSNYLIDSCWDRTLNCIQNTTWGDTFTVANPVTFKGAQSYIAMPTLNAYTSMSLFMSIKTIVMDGLILYNGGPSGDFIAVELSGGQVFYIYNLGNGPQVLTVPESAAVNDNKWHDIRVTRSSRNVHTLTVDGKAIKQTGLEQRRHLDLNGYFYVGGVSQIMYINDLPDIVASRTGFQGCLGSLEVNGNLQDLRNQQGKITIGKVAAGCLAPSPPCTPTTCSNGGVCLQQWDGFKCDCSLTAYVGKLCQQRGNSYKFGPGAGLMLYKWPNTYPSTRSDRLALGFSTSLRDCVILKVTGYTEAPAQDFLLLAIENGKLILRFNVGGASDVVLREGMSVSDGSYHTVQVRRQWLNATMRVDNWPVRSVAPPGDARSRFARVIPSIASPARPTIDKWLQRKEQQTSVFNSQSTIQIGGLLGEDVLSTLDQSRDTRTVAIDRPFRGQMTGLFFNDVRVFQLAAQRDDQVRFLGDVTRIGGPDLLPTSPTINQPTTTMATLTIFSTTKSSENVPNGSNSYDCDDEDLCPNSSGSGSGFFTQIGESQTLSDVTQTTSLHASADNSQQRGQGGDQNGEGLESLLMIAGFYTTQLPTLSTTKSSVRDADADVINKSPRGTEKVTSAPVVIEGNERQEKLFYDMPSLSEILDIFTSPEVLNDPNEKKDNSSKSASFTSDISLDDALKFFTNEETYDPEVGSVYDPIAPSQSSRNVVDYQSGDVRSLTTLPVTRSSKNLNLLKSNPRLEEHSATPTLINPPVAPPFVVTPPYVDTTKQTSAVDFAHSLVTHSPTKSMFHTLGLKSTVSKEAESSTPPSHASNPRIVLPFSTPTHTSPGAHTDPAQPTSTFSTTTAVADWRDLASGVTLWDSAPTSLNRLEPSTDIGYSSPPPPIPPMTPTRSANTNTRTPTSTITSDTNTTFTRSLLTDVIVRDVTDPKSDVTAPEGNSNAGGGQPMPNPHNPRRGNMINVSNTSSTPSNVTGYAGSNVTGSVMISDAGSLTTVMIAGIAAAAACCVLLLFYMIYRFKYRDSVTYNVDERERQYGANPIKGKKVVQTKNGSMKRDPKTQKTDKDKEYYV